MHNQSFTIYPPGFIPFGRHRLVPRHERWESTFFSAALDAAQKERWSDIGDDRGWWTTQWRHLTRLGELLALEAGGRIAELVAEALGVELHLHVEAQETFGSGGFRKRGRAVVQMLKAVVAAGAGVLRRLLHAGHVANWCGRAFWADPRSGLRSMAPF